MIKYYAQLNENNICIGVSQLSGEIQKDNLIEIESANIEYIWKKYDHITQTWSTEKFEPASTSPIDEFNSMKQQIEELTLQLGDALLGGAL